MKKHDAQDFLTVLGLICTMVGLWQVYPPLAFIAFGVICFFAGTTPRGQGR